MELTPQEERIIKAFRKGFKVELTSFNKHDNLRSELEQLGYKDIGSYTSQKTDVSWLEAQDGENITVVSMK